MAPCSPKIPLAVQRGTVREALGMKQPTRAPCRDSWCGGAKETGMREDTLFGADVWRCGGANGAAVERRRRRRGWAVQMCTVVEAVVSHQ